MSNNLDSEWHVIFVSALPSSFCNSVKVKTEYPNQKRGKYKIFIQINGGPGTAVLVEKQFFFSIMNLIAMGYAYGYCPSMSRNSA